MKVGILTSGGDCQALNGAMRGVVKGLVNNSPEPVEIIGINRGYTGLIYGDYKEMSPDEFEDILNKGGTILGSSRQQFKRITIPDEQGNDKVACMIDNYNKIGLDCLVVLGGNGSHKTANMLSEKGLNVVTLPKTIDNDINGTDMTFGFMSGLDIATRAIDEVRTTADSHGRVMIVEVMGNKTGWLTLYSGLAGAADVILVPEIPYDIKYVRNAINDAFDNGKKSVVLAIAEGIISKEESEMKKKQLKAKREKEGFISAGYRLCSEIGEIPGHEVRVVVPGHVQRGGNPCAYDRVLTSRLGAKASELIINKDYGRMACIVGNHISSIPLEEAVEMTKKVDPSDDIVRQVRQLGISLGDK